MIKRVMMTAMLAVSGIGTVPADELAWLDAYNVVWNSQSSNAGERYPVRQHGPRVIPARPQRERRAVFFVTVRAGTQKNGEENQGFHVWHHTSYSDR